jgi:hypothetical protein
MYVAQFEAVALFKLMRYIGKRDPGENRKRVGVILLFSSQFFESIESRAIVGAKIVTYFLKAPLNRKHVF